MRRSKVHEWRRASEIFSAMVVSIIAQGVLPGCPSTTDPPKETAKSESAPVAAAPSSSSSSSAAAPVAVAPSASATAPEPAPQSQSIDPETVTALLVWQKDDKARGGYRTQWIGRQGDKPHVADERPGVLFMSSTSLWTLETTVVKGCSQNARHPNGEPFVIHGVVQKSRPGMDMPELARIADGKRVAPWKDGHGYPYTGTQCDPAIEEYSVNVTFEGGMGPFVVARMKSYTFTGGAHGVRGEELFTIDLEKLDKVTLLPRPEDRAAVIANAAKGLGVKPEGVTSNGILLMYGPNGAGVAVYRYWGASDYAGGSGGNSYSTDFEVTSKNLPLEVAGFGKLPAWALPLLRPKSVPVFMVPPARRELFKSQFDAAYAEAKQP